MMARAIWAGILAAAVLVSAVGIVYAKHQGRRLFVELQALQGQRDALDVEWGRLQLEQSTWATHGRVDKLARERLQMTVPAPQATVILRR